MGMVKRRTIEIIEIESESNRNRIEIKSKSIRLLSNQTCHVSSANYVFDGSILNDQISRTQKCVFDCSISNDRIHLISRTQKYIFDCSISNDWIHFLPVFTVFRPSIWTAYIALLLIQFLDKWRAIQMQQLQDLLDRCTYSTGPRRPSKYVYIITCTLTWLVKPLMIHLLLHAVQTTHHTSTDWPWCSIIFLAIGCTICLQLFVVVIGLHEPNLFSCMHAKQNPVYTCGAV